MLAGFRWCYEDFVRFFELYEALPDGQEPTTLREGFWRLILRQVFEGTEGRDRRFISNQDDFREVLALIPKGHAKTTVFAALGIFHLLVVPNANVYIGAADKIQAGEMYRFASHFVDSEPEISALLKVLGGTKEIRARKGQGFLLVLASDDSKQGGKRQGFNPTLALLDELHAHENDLLYTDMRSGLFKRNGLLVTITTAGWDLEGALGRLRQSFLDAAVDGGSVRAGLVVDDAGDVSVSPDGRLTVCRKASGNAVMFEWALRKGDDFTDMRVVKLANPASWITPASLADAYESLRLTMFKRYRCNLWSLAFESWIPEDAWSRLTHSAVPVVEHRLWNGAAKDEIDAHIRSWWPEDTPLVGYVDMARYRDCAAIVCIGEGPDGLWTPRALVWRSGGQDDPIPYGPIMDAWRTVHATYDLRAAGFDPKYFDQAAEQLEDEGLAMELSPQSPERMSYAAVGLRQDILERRVFAHDGDPILATHVLAAVEKDVGESFRLVKSSRNGPPIDACIALAGANDLRDMLDDSSGEPLVGFV